jgi:hypothetical protein
VQQRRKQHENSSRRYKATHRYRLNGSKRAPYTQQYVKSKSCAAAGHD